MCLQTIVYETGKTSLPGKTNQREATQSQTDCPTPDLPRRSPSPTKRKTEVNETYPVIIGAVVVHLLETEIHHHPLIMQLSRGTGTSWIIMMAGVMVGVGVMTVPETMDVILVGAEAEIPLAGETTTEIGETGIGWDIPLPQEIVPMLIFQTDIDGDRPAHPGGKCKQRHLIEWSLIEE